MIPEMTQAKLLGEMKQRCASHSADGICQQVVPRGRSTGQIDLMELVCNPQRKRAGNTVGNSGPSL